MGLLRLEPLEPRDLPAGLFLSSAGGGLVEVRDLDTAAVVREFRPFGDFDGLVFVEEVPGGDYVVAAGDSGGPRAKRVDGATGRTVWDAFLGDPDSRRGVSVAALDAVAADASPVVVTAHPTHPGNAAAVERHLAAMPDGAEAWVAARFPVVAYDGPNVTVLPEFAHRRDRPEFRAAGSIAPTVYGGPAYVQAGPLVGAAVVLHEVGHGIFFHASEDVRRAGDPSGQWSYRWQEEVYRGRAWEGPSRLNSGEAAAEAVYFRFAGLPQQNADRVDPFLDEMFAAVFGGA